MAIQSTCGLNFDGTGNVSIPGMPVPAGDMTLSLWIKTTDTSSDRGIFGRWDAIGYMLYSSGSDLRFYCSDGGGGQNIAWSGGWASVADGAWHHILAAKSGTTGTIYLDGVSVYSASGLGSTQGAPADVGDIGTYSDRTGSRITALIDDAALWDSDQSANAAGIYAGSTDVTTLSPLGLWIRADPGSGSTITDSGSGGHDGTTVGGVTWSALDDVPPPLTDRIVFDAATNSGGFSGTGASWTHTCGTFGSRYLVVGVCLVAPSITVTGITYNGVSMDFLFARTSVSTNLRVELWGLKIPDAGANTVLVTLSGSIGLVVAGAVSFFNVSQSSPTDGTNGNGAVNVGAADATVSLTTVADYDWVVDVVSAIDGSITVGAGQTQRMNVVASGNSEAMSTKGPVHPAGSTTMYWTDIGALAEWVIACVALKNAIPVATTPPVGVIVNINQAVLSAATF